jgi:hypothetical protein
MKKVAQLIFIQIVIFSFSLKAQNQTDSLIRFFDLRFHSDFEKEALVNFVKHGKDTFNLFFRYSDDTLPVIPVIPCQSLFDFSG